MSPSAEVSVDDFKASLTPDKRFRQALLYIALLTGPLGFGIVTIVVRSNNAAPSVTSGVDVFTTMNAIITVTMIGVAWLTPTVVFSNPELTVFAPGSRRPGMTLEERCFLLIQTACVIRLGVLEGASLFGLICCFLGKSWFNALSLLPLFLVGVLTFPNNTRIMRNFIVHIKKDPRLLTEYTI